MNRDHVDSIVASAFDTVERDDSMTLHQAQVVESAMEADDLEHRQRFEAARNRDPETHWQDIPASSIDECPAALYFLEPPGWRFYLPAFMRRALQVINDSEFDTLIPCYVIHNLTLRDRSDLQDHNLRRFESLSASQARAVAAFLEYVASLPSNENAEDARDALESYWKRFTI